ncbi:MAG: rod shape-determining protein MreC [Actinomycetota bacterium]|nr:rod shape-determining protein MreC [Actinomycetota bacterium]
MALSRRSGRSRLTLIFLILTSITVITLDFRGDGAGLIGSLRDGAADALSPVRSAAASVLEPVGDALAGVTAYGELEEENAALRARVAELEGSELRDESAEEELDEARRLLELELAPDVPRINARVVSTPISNFEQTIELDRGAGDGVGVDMPVVTGAGLVGRVVGVSGSRSTVLLVTDPASAVGVRLARSGELAVASGEGPEVPLSLDFVDTEADVDLLELVVTDGLDASMFPPDIPVGRVSLAEAAPGQLQRRVEVRPVAELAQLRLVSVLQWRPG